MITSTLLPQYQIEQLRKEHNKDLFSCGNAALDHYLKIQANQDIKRNIAITYVLTQQNSKHICGFYTISSIGIFPGELPHELIKKLPKYPILPGILLGRLAVTQSMQNKKIGALLLIDALKRSLAVSHQIGIIAIIVDAKDAIAVRFYKHFGFIHFSTNEHRLFLPIDTIKKLNLL